MNHFFNNLNQDWIKIGLGILVLGTLFFNKEWNSQPKTVLINFISTPTLITRGAWLDNLDNLIAEESDKNAECLNATKEQVEYLKNEKLSEQFTFDKYQVTSLLNSALKNLDIDSNKYARMFKTRIREELEKNGINFAGHYSIVSVGMTGWGENYYIIDRNNGEAYTFPYWAYDLMFRKDSNLIILNPKDMIFREMRSMPDYIDNCGYKMAESSPLVLHRPFYFIWENNELKLIGPFNIKPLINKFWEQ